MTNTTADEVDTTTNIIIKPYSSLNCSLNFRRRKQRKHVQFLHSSNSAKRSVYLPIFSFLLLVFSVLPCSVLSFNSGQVETVPGSIVARNPRPLTGPSLSSIGGGGRLPPAGDSRSAILMKLTSPRREFGGHVYDPRDQSPIASDLYAFSRSTESEQIPQENTNARAPFVRFPTISSPFSSIASTHSSETLQQYQRHQKSTKKPYINIRTTKPPQQKGHTKPLSQSVSDILAQQTPREEPSSLFTGDLEEDLLDSYYTTTGSDDDVAGMLSSMDVENDRYNSQQIDDDLFEKQTATVEDASFSSATNKNKSSDSRSKTFGNHSNTASPSALSKPTLLPLPANYLSMATFKQIDNTVEKSSSNILSRIANFWKNRTMNSRHNSSSSLTSNKRITNKSNAVDGANNSNSINYTKLASDSSSIDADQSTHNHNHENNEETDNISMKITDHQNDNRSGIIRNHRTKNSNNKNSRRQSESSSAQQHKETSQPPKYISIEDVDGGTIFGGGGASNQYLSLDDDEDGDLGVVGEEDFVGGSTKEDEHTVGTKTTTTKTQSSSGKEQDDDHQRNHDHQHLSSSSIGASVEDYIASESSAGGEGADWLDDVGGGDSALHSFHDDLFHPATTGTITAVIENIPKKDLMSSGSSKIERVQKSDSASKNNSSSKLSGVPFIIGGGTAPSSPSSSSTSRGQVRKAESDKIWSSIDSHFGRNDLIESAESREETAAASDQDYYYYGMTIGGFLKRELWTIPLFVLASLNMILIILFEVYVLCRARGTSRRHLFLGQMLLFGLFLCSFLALMFAVHPSIVGCFVGRLGVGITYSLIFSVLMVKCVFLLSLDTGVYLPTSYQGILLFFAVAVQVAIDSQWVIMYPPFLQTVESGRSILLQCGTSFVQLLYSLSYVGFLILMVGFLAGRAAYKGVVENYRESVYILITAVVTVPVALSWTVAGWMLQGRHQDACVSFGLVAHSLTTFLIMFMPKGRQLASLDKEAVCFDDQEDQCSGYSPSFFHFKPTTKNYKTALWGDGNLYTTLEPTVSTINPNVFFHRNDFHSGMIY